MDAGPLPTLDAHAHLDPTAASEELERSGAVLANTLSLNEAGPRHRSPGAARRVGHRVPPKEARASVRVRPGEVRRVGGAGVLLESDHGGSTRRRPSPAGWSGRSTWSPSGSD